jgi:ribosomal 30S subunit maturation factor RimM
MQKQMEDQCKLTENTRDKSKVLRVKRMQMSKRTNIAQFWGFDGREREEKNKESKIVCKKKMRTAQVCKWFCVSGA